MRIPESERATYLQTLTRAQALAAAGDFAAGRDHLADGLERARAAEADGEPWGKALIARYELGLAWYTHHCGGPRKRSGTRGRRPAPEPCSSPSG